LLDWFRNPSGPAPAGLADELHGHLGIKRAAAEPAPVPSGQASGVLLDDMSIGILIIDADGRYNYVNETAARVLGRPRAALIGMRAAAPLAAFARRHRAEAAQTGVTVTAERLAFGGDRASVVAIARPADAARVAIVLPVLLSARPAFSELLAKLFDLTHAERSLASELSGGANLTEIADLRGVSIATVRTQVRAVYSKIGVSGQNDLARTLTMLHAAIGAAPG
jgi:DNA-binding CsgD family transcriptional regulator